MDNITNAVKFFSKELSCSQSCVWNNINGLKRCGLVRNGPNKPVSLTEIAKTILDRGEKL
jgi:Mn-dependent DtxR family transcriptional regulator